MGPETVILASNVLLLSSVFRELSALFGVIIVE